MMEGGNKELFNNKNLEEKISKEELGEYYESLRKLNGESLDEISNLLQEIKNSRNKMESKVDETILEETENGILKEMN